MVKPIDPSKLTIKQLRGLRSYTQASFIEAVGFDQSQAEFSRSVDCKTLEELRSPLIERLQLIYRMESILCPQDKK